MMGRVVAWPTLETLRGVVHVPAVVRSRTATSGSFCWIGTAKSRLVLTAASTRPSGAATRLTWLSAVEVPGPPKAVSLVQVPTAAPSLWTAK